MLGVPPARATHRSLQGGFRAAGSPPPPGAPLKLQYLKHLIDAFYTSQGKPLQSQYFKHLIYGYNYCLVKIGVKYILYRKLHRNVFMFCFFR